MVGVIFVFDPARSAEPRHRESSNVARGEHLIPVGNTPVLVDDDPVLDRKPGGLSELDARHDAESGNHGARLDHAPVGEPDPPAVDRCHLRARRSPRPRGRGRGR